MIRDALIAILSLLLGLLLPEEGRALRKWLANTPVMFYEWKRKLLGRCPAIDGLPKDSITVMILLDGALLKGVRIKLKQYGKRFSRSVRSCKRGVGTLGTRTCRGPYMLKVEHKKLRNASGSEYMIDLKGQPEGRVLQFASTDTECFQIGRGPNTKNKEDLEALKELQRGINQLRKPS